MENAIELKNVTKRFQGFALENVSFTLPKGCIMGLIGENGAGKSTTIKLILDLLGKDSGEIVILGDKAEVLGREQRERIGVVLDESCFPENLTRLEINRILKRIYRQWDEAAFEKYMNAFHLPEKKQVKDYSRGMKMKLGIAAALSHGAELLILDEATSGLDPVVRDEILEVFLEFIQDDNHSILMSTHITSDLEKACDYITFIHQGKILLSEAKDELLDKYGLLKCAEEELKNIDKAALRGVRRNRFGVEALVLREKIRGNYVIDPVDIEDIMLYQIRGGMRV